MNVITRRCSKCKSLLPLTKDHFNKSSNPRAKGFQYVCRKCSAALSSKRYFDSVAKDPDFNKKRVAEWKKTDPGRRKRMYKKHRAYALNYSHAYRASIEGRQIGMVNRCKATAKKRGHDFSLTLDFIKKLWEQQDGKCCLTGIAFDLSRPTGTWKTNPYSPSVDRIDCSQGYIPQNVRLVATAVNRALNEYGDKVFDAICKARINKIGELQ